MTNKGKFFIIFGKEHFNKDTNGKRIGEDGYMFLGPDPHFAFKVPEFAGESGDITMTILVDEIPAEIASRLG